ncbi:MAG: MFS transporter [Actinomycetota bacterium]|nr:MFS transporter [Actinomycetota bacterium]
MTAALRRTVGSFEVPNYRRWFGGQLVSVGGNWMQIVAEVWLVLTITGSAFAVGITSALQFLPILLVGAWGGLMADSMPKRRLLLFTQSLMVVPPLVLFGLTATGSVDAWMVMALVFARGLVLAVDMPARHSFVIEIVGPDRVVSAVGLQSVLIHTSRITGPALAGVLIAGGSIELCFLLNALSFVGMIVALRSLDRTALAPPKLAVREPGAIRAGFRYVTRTPELAVPLGMMALVGTLGLNFHVLLPLLARQTFDGGPESYSTLVIAMAIGAVAGALAAGTRERISQGLLVGSALAFGVFALIAAAAPSLTLEAIALVPLGTASVTFAAGVNSTLQLAAAPAMRGRVMALYATVFLGSTAVGGPLTGWLSGVWDARAALVMAGLSAIVAGAGAAFAFRRLSPEPAVEAEASPAEPGLGRDRACEPTGRGGGPATPRRRSEHRRDPRSPAPRPRADARRAR